MKLVNITNCRYPEKLTVFIPGCELNQITG